MKILNRWNGAALWESPCSTLRDANLRDADLRDANLRDANLRDANLRGANLRDADLCDADLRDADLCDADLCGANLRGADLRGANLRDADLCGANLRDADLCGADLRDAELRGAENAELAIAMTRILPAGEIIGWKKAHGPKADVLVQLRIPESAKRTHALGRKCRASEAVVVAIEGAETATAHYDSSVKYIIGETVKPTAPFDDDWTQECSSGIHFYITKEEAMAHTF